MEKSHGTYHPTHPPTRISPRSRSPRTRSPAIATPIAPPTRPRPNPGMLISLNLTKSDTQITGDAKGTRATREDWNEFPGYIKLAADRTVRSQSQCRPRPIHGWSVPVDLRAHLPLRLETSRWEYACQQALVPGSWTGRLPIVNSPSNPPRLKMTHPPRLRRTLSSRPVRPGPSLRLPDPVSRDPGL